MDCNTPSENRPPIFGGLTTQDHASGTFVADSFTAAFPRSLHDLLRALFRYRRRAAIFFVLTMGLATIGILLAPRVYRSEAQLFVKLGRESIGLDPTAGATGSVVALNVTRESEINSIIQVMGSRAVAEKAVIAIDPAIVNKPQMTRERAISKLMKGLRIWSPRDTTVIGVSADTKSPAQAQQTVQVLLDVFLKEHLRLNRTPGSHKFFDEQTSLLQSKLDGAAKALRDAKTKYKLVSIEGRHLGLQAQINTVEQEDLATEAAISASRAKIDSLRETLTLLPEDAIKSRSGQSKALDSLHEKTYELVTQQHQLRSRLTAKHPLAIAIDEQVVEAEQLLANEQASRTQAMRGALLDEESTYHSLQARAESLEQQMDRLNDELATLNEQEVEIKELERQVQVAERNYLNYVASLEQTRVDEALRQGEISNINVVQSASLMERPVRPRKRLAMALALLASTVGSLGVAFLSDRLDTSLRRREDIERLLRLPVIVTVPRGVATHQALLHS